mgnify:CR=1 FL=1
MIYEVRNQIDGFQYFDEATNPNAKTDAEAARVIAAANYLIQEKNRFSIAHTVVDGNDTVWREVNDSDPEEGDYKCFVHYTGQYETYQTLSAAKARVEELKKQLIVESFLDQIFELAEIPTPPTRNSLVDGAQKF